MKLKVLAFDDTTRLLFNLRDASTARLSEFNLAAHLVNSESEWRKAAAILKEEEGDFAVLLDLGFRSAGVPCWEAVRNALTTQVLEQYGCCVNREDDSFLFPVDGMPVPVPGEAIDGVALVSALLESQKPGRTLVVTMSNRGGLNQLNRLLPFLSALFRKEQHCRRVEFDREVDGLIPSNSADANAILNNLNRAWQSCFPDFHELSSDVDRWIRAWLTLHRTLTQANVGDQFCLHGTTRRGAIGTSRAQYETLMSEMFGPDAGAAIRQDLKGLKAILMIEKAPDDLNSPEESFKQWQADMRRPAFHPISTEALRPVLRAIFGANFRLEVDGKMHLPAQPGLPFLFSLRVLIDVMRNEGSGIFDEAASVVLTGPSPDRGGATERYRYPYRLAIPLKQEAGKLFALAKRWREKCMTSVINDGVCGALWNASLGRVEVKRNTANEEERQLLRIFEGEGKPVAAVGFAPHAVHLYWE